MTEVSLGSSMEPSRFIHHVLDAPRMKIDTVVIVIVIARGSRAEQIRLEH